MKEKPIRICTGNSSESGLSVLLCKVPDVSITETFSAPLKIRRRDGASLQLQDNAQLLWMGRRDLTPQAKTHPFALVDRGDHWELKPISGLYTFTPDTERRLGTLDVDQAEKQRRLQRAKEEAAYSKIELNG